MRFVKVKKHICAFCYTLIFVICFFFAAKFLNTASGFLDAALIASGCSVQKIDITGNHMIAKDQILQKSQKFLGQNTFVLPIFFIRQDLKRLSWCKEAIVVKKLPAELVIKIIEHQPFAVLNGRHIITKDFYKIIDFDIKQHKQLKLLYVNSDKEKEAMEFLLNLKKCIKPEVFVQIKSADHISGRRWNIKMQNNLVIKLSEKDPIKTFIGLDKYFWANFSASKVIDARTPGRVYLA